MVVAMGPSQTALGRAARGLLRSRAVPWASAPEPGPWALGTSVQGQGCAGGGGAGGHSGHTPLMDLEGFMWMESLPDELFSAARRPPRSWDFVVERVAGFSVERDWPVPRGQR